MNMGNTLFVRIELFYCHLQAGDYDHPFDLAVALEGLGNSAWDEVERLYPDLLPKIEPGK